MAPTGWRGLGRQEAADKGLMKRDGALTIPETGFKWHNTFYFTRDQKPEALRPYADEEA